MSIPPNATPPGGGLIPGARWLPKEYPAAGENITFLVANGDGTTRPATRPPNSALREMRRLMIDGTPYPDESAEDYNEQISAGNAANIELARAHYEMLVGLGFDLSATVDWRNVSWSNFLANVRMYGYRWALTGVMTPPATTEGYLGDPPAGALIVPATDAEDPNNVHVPVAPPPPVPTGQPQFGPPWEASEYPGAYMVGADNDVPPGTHGTKDGIEYVYIVLGKLGTIFYRKLWVPVGR